MRVQLSAQIFRVLATIVAAFQAALALGAPWGQLTWGGRYTGTLPLAMRGVAIFSMLLMVLFAWIVTLRAGGRRAAGLRRVRVGDWIVVCYCAIGVIANAATPSAWERVGARGSEWERVGARGSEWERVGARGSECCGCRLLRACP